MCLIFLFTLEYCNDSVLHWRGTLSGDRIGHGALAEPARLELLEVLCQCERGVEEVAGLVGARVNTVSHHPHVRADRKLMRELRNRGYSASRISERIAEWRTTGAGIVEGAGETSP